MYSFDRQLAKTLRKDGMKVSEIAEKFGVSPWVIYTTTRPLIRRSSAGRPPSFDHAEALELAKAGESFAAIARRFSTTRQAVHQIVHKLDPDFHPLREPS